jgi:hypothetical protein
MAPARLCGEEWWRRTVGRTSRPSRPRPV